VEETSVAKIEVDGTTLEYSEVGSGRPVVLVHGSASDYRTWKYQLDEFGKRFRAIAYSRRYHWPNEQIPEGVDYSMIEHVDDLERLLQSLHATPAHLVGHSYGAFVCLLLAMRAPRTVRSLVLAEPPALTLFTSNSPKPLELLKLSLTRPRTAVAIVKFGVAGVEPATKAIKRGDRESCVRLFGTAVMGRKFFRALSESRLEQVRANLIKTELTGSGFAPLDSDRIREIRIPALLLNAQQSPRFFHRLMDRLQELLPAAERFEIPGASHIMHEDNAPVYNTTVLSFLEKQSQPA
jgi:pimeloyl-ACP methyl ester carboxylesterase